MIPLAFQTLTVAKLATLHEGTCTSQAQWLKICIIMHVYSSQLRATIQDHLINESVSATPTFCNPQF